MSKTISNDKDPCQKMKLSNFDLKAAYSKVGCLTIFWNEKLDLKILETNKWYIHCVIDKGKSGSEWFATFIHGLRALSYRKKKGVFGINYERLDRIS